MSRAKKTVEWKIGSVFKADPTLALREVQKVNNDYGGEPPDGALVEHARDVNSVLHHDFEWDDTIAAHKQRVETEKKIKRSLVYVCRRESDQPEEAKVVRVFSSVKRTDEDGYTTRFYLNTVDAMKDPVYREQIIANAQRELQQFHNKYHSLLELADVLDPIKKRLDIG